MSSGSAGPGAVLSHGCASSQSRTNCLSKLGLGPAGLRTSAASQKRERVGRQHLVDEQQLLGARVDAELELRVGQDDPGALGDGRGRARTARARPDGRGSASSSADRASTTRSNGMFSSCSPWARLRRGREDRLGKPVALAQAGRQRDAADRARRPVLLPAASRRGSRGRRTRPAATSARRQIIIRPRSSSDDAGSPIDRAAASSGSVDQRWFGTIVRRLAGTRSATDRSGPGPCPGSASAARRRTR